MHPSHRRGSLNSLSRLMAAIRAWEIVALVGLWSCGTKGLGTQGYRRQRSWMSQELTYSDEAVAGYGRAFAHVSAHFIPFLLCAAHVAPSMRVLDINKNNRLSALVVKWSGWFGFKGTVISSVG